MKIKYFFTSSVIIFSLFTLNAQESDSLQQNISNLENIVIVGGRNTARTAINSPVAIDVIDVKKIEKLSPQATVNDLLNYLVPSFNSVKQSSSDGTEHIDPATLRGMGPDQVLVLINGKRRHTTSLVNYQNTVGNGSVGTDLSAIPASAIERIEVLRDGAAAQYGSDAIAGVINIVLKKSFGGSISATYGVTNRNDGENYSLSSNYGTKLGNDGGSINLSFVVSQRNATNRSYENNLDKFGDNFAYDFAPDPAQARANDETIMAARGLSQKDFRFRIGDAKIKNQQFFINVIYPLSQKLEFYIFGGASLRQGEGAEFRRLPSETDNVVSEIYPNGFQPLLKSNIYDISQVAGIKYKYDNWIIDLSNTFGENIFNYQVANTNNASLGIHSPTRFNAGGHSFLQNTINLDVSKKINSYFSLGLGTEFRYEQYKITAGEEASWARYDKYGNIVSEVTKPEDIIGAGGSQGFVGFSPLNSINKNRTSVATYADLAFTLGRLSGNIAGRYEHFSDFGNSVTGKLAVRYEYAQGFAIRGAVSTGFRAPSLQQQYFNNSYTDISTTGNKIVAKGIFTNDSNLAKALGIEKLKDEKSVNVSVGLTFRPVNKLYITLDGYYIRVNDRIVLTSEFVNDLIQSYGVEGARFFTNAVDTETKGIDWVAAYSFYVGAGKLDVSLSGNYTETKIIDYHFPEVFGGDRNEYFGPDQVNIIESLTPKSKASLGLIYTLNKWNFLVRNTYYGKVTRNGYPYGGIQYHSPKYVTDFSISYSLTKNLGITLGGNNVFDIFPDKQIYENSYYNVFKYAPVQMGITGANWFARLNMNF
ncbi:TonB-dependent receptor [Apibacter raozihei]|uniref:TonB-dependent receptor plug domain-containing protein n=1 Tax=Apibacter raozihei TaxID=2500547 RepID=UPI000FE3568F|nr:TonB-dependent receptor [Apibacter raozihei]